MYSKNKSSNSDLVKNNDVDGETYRIYNIKFQINDEKEKTTLTNKLNRNNKVNKIKRTYTKLKHLTPEQRMKHRKLQKFKYANSKKLINHFVVLGITKRNTIWCNILFTKLYL